MSGKTKIIRKQIVLTTGGCTNISLYPSSASEIIYAYHVVEGTETLTSDFDITATEKTVRYRYLNILWNANVTTGGNSVTILGKTVPESVLAAGSFIVEAWYDGDNWVVSIIPIATLVDTEAIADTAITTPKIENDAVTTDKIATSSVTTLKIADDAITNAKLANITRGSVKVGGASDAPTDLDAKTSGNILVGDGTDVVSVHVSGDATLSSLGALTIGSNAITTSKITDANVTLAKLEQKLLYDMFTIRLDTKSAAATGNVNFTMPYDCDITHIVITVLEAAADDDTTFVFKDNGGASMGSIDVTTAMSIGNKATLGSSGSPLSSNNSFSRDHNLLIEVTKTTTTSGAYHIAIYTERT